MVHTLTKTLGAACVALLLVPPAPAQEVRFNALWADLASADEGKAVRATLGLAAMSKEAVPFLKQRLQPVKVDAARVGKLVKQLDSEEFDQREAAGKDLEYLGKYVKPLLEKHAADADISAEAKRAIRDVISKIPPDETAPPPAPKIMGRSVSIRTQGNGEIQIIIDGKPLDLTAYAPKPPPGPNMNWVRAVRAVAVLEHLGTPEARQLLEAVADGEADAAPTKAAKEALGRMKK
jgi:hypothetical protein